MAFIHLNFYSDSLKVNTDVNVILPTPNPDELLMKKDTGYFRDGMQYQVLYLLHGTFGDYSDWCRNTCVERYAQQHKVAVVMPSGTNSFYFDMFIGSQFFTYLTTELPIYITRLFSISSKREDNFIAGLSMGGYGAWRAALLKPHQYGAAASLSGTLDFGHILNGGVIPDEPWPFKAIFEKNDPKVILKDDANLLVMLAKMRKEILPKLFHCGGTDDFLYSSNLNFFNSVKNLGIDVTYEESPGIHDWTFWDTHIQRVFKWLPLKRIGKL